MINASELLSSRARTIPPSKMTAFFNLAPDVISLAIGEPGFPTPLSIGNGGIEAIKAGKTSYPPSSGYGDLREKTAKYLADRFHYSYSPDEVLITNGASLGLDGIMRTYIEAGDEVIIPAPAYGYYLSLVCLSGGKAVLAPTYAKDHWALTAEELKKAITPRTKMLVLNYPNNPTGATMTNTQLAAIADIIRDTDMIVVSDEVYAECVFTNLHRSILNHPDMRERTLLVSSFSKSMAMAGWRIGYVCAPRDLLDPVAALNATVALCASGIAQSAVLRGLTCGHKDIEYMSEEYRIRRDYAWNRIQEFGWKCALPRGAFYLWVDISPTGMDAESFAHGLIAKAKVAIIPGTVFGEDYSNYVRITCSASMDILREALNRIDEYCGHLRP